MLFKILKGNHMTFWLNFERLEHNDLPLPKYATEGSSGVDLQACLTRECITGGNADNPPVRFYVDDMGKRHMTYENTNIIKNEGRVKSLNIRPQETILVPTGFKSEFSSNEVLEIHPRSSLGRIGIILANNTGIIDSDYRGEIFICLYNRSNRIYYIKHGDRIAQAILKPIARAVIKEATVDQTTRGSGGFGSTGS